MAIYTTDGEFVRRIVVTEENNFYITGITVSIEGHIAVTVKGDRNGKVIVL